jgi:hypothetical protein
MYLIVRYIGFASFSCLLDFGAVQTLWYFILFPSIYRTWLICLRCHFYNRSCSFFFFFFCYSESVQCLCFGPHDILLSPWKCWNHIEQFISFTFLCLFYIDVCRCLFVSNDSFILVELLTINHCLRYIFISPGLWCLTPLSTISQLYRGGQFESQSESGVPEENHRPVTSRCQTWSHNVVSSTPRHQWDSISDPTRRPIHLSQVYK